MGRELVAGCSHMQSLLPCETDRHTHDTIPGVSLYFIEDVESSRNVFSRASSNPPHSKTLILLLPVKTSCFGVGRL